MIPMWMKIRFPVKEKRPVTLFIPLILIWLLLLVLFVLILPIWLAASLIVYLLGFGRAGLTAVPLIMTTLWHLQGLELELGSGNKRIILKWL
jgi:hypothetical protein